MQLDQHGHLTYFEARPPQVLKDKGATAVDWTPLFAAAGLDPAKLTADDPVWTWLSTSDVRAAWTGTWPGSDRPMRVEAAALRGKPVGFHVMGPWTQPWRNTGPEGSILESPVFLLQITLLLAILVGAPLLARQNLLRRRGDRSGALRLAVFLFVVQMALWLCRSHVIVSLGTFGMFLVAVCTGSFAALLVWTCYLALEPYVRRNWPRTLMASTGLLAGRWSDPVVGRDVLSGMLGGLLLHVAGQAFNHWSSKGRPNFVDTDTLLGVRGQLGALLQQVPYAARNALFFLFLLFLLRVLLRNQWAAAAAFAAIFTVLSTSGGPLDYVVGFGLNAILAVLLLRWGLLAGAVAYWVSNVMSFPITTHTGAWYYGNAVWVLVLLVLMAGWALRVSIRGRRLLPHGLFG